MGKTVRRLVGLAAFLVTFACAVIAVFLLSTGLVDVSQFLPMGGGIQPPTSGPPQVEVPQIAPGEATTLADVVQPRPLLSSVPTPLDLSTQPKVLGANLFLAILMALLFGATSTVLSNMLRDEEETIRGWLDKLGIFKLFPKGMSWAARRAVARGCLTLPIFALIFALYGIIFAFLERGTSVLSQSGAFLAVTLAFSVGLVSFAGDIAQRIIATFWRTDARLRIYPANLLMAILTVITSRLFVLTPGIVFGTPGGVDIDLSEKQRGRQVALALATLFTTAILGGVGWAVSGAVQVSLNQPIDTRVADLAVTLLSAAQNTSLAVFLIAMETLFFEMLPLAYGLGQTFFQWNKIAWGVLFAPIAFLFNHTLLNPNSGFLESFQVSNVRFMWFVLFMLVGITAALWIYFNVLREMLNGPPAPPSAAPPLEPPQTPRIG
jgi:hypothetical protein